MSLGSEVKTAGDLPVTLLAILIEDLVESTQTYAFQESINFATVSFRRSATLLPRTPATPVPRGTGIESRSSFTCRKNSTASSNLPANSVSWTRSKVLCIACTLSNIRPRLSLKASSPFSNRTLLVASLTCSSKTCPWRACSTISRAISCDLCMSTRSCLA